MEIKDTVSGYAVRAWRGQGQALTRRCYHALPLLEKAGLEAVSGAEAVGLVTGHEFLHGLEYHTELG